MLSSIKEFHEARLLKETQELEEKTGADKSGRKQAGPDASFPAGTPRLGCATRCDSRLWAIAPPRSLRLGGVCMIVGLATLLGARSALTPATTGPDGDSAGVTAFAGADSAGHTSVAGEGVSVVRSWDGGVGDGFGAADMQELYHLARDDVLDIVSEGDESCDNWRKTESARCADANNCGKGWLFRKKGLLLALPWAGLNDSSVTEEWPVGEARAVTIVGLKEGGNGEESDCNAGDLSMLFRLQGPEALAEAAVPVEGRCAWSAVFRPLLEGTFTFTATLINWKGGSEIHREMCNEVVGAYGEGSVQMGAVPTGGGPFYGNFEGCCTLCTRAEGCVAWSATSNAALALVEGDRCALYSSVSGEPVEDISLNKIVRSGTSRLEEAMMYLAPSMSLDRSWCSERNGGVLGSDKEFRVKASPVGEDGDGAEAVKDGFENHAPTVSVGGDGDSALPLCRSNLLHEGRWVSLKDVECNFQDKMMAVNGWPNFNNDISMPEECLLKPGDKQARLEEDERHLAEGGYVWKPYECQYDLINTDARHSCFKEKNITSFLDFGDSMTSTSRRPRSALWLPNVPSLWSTGLGTPQIEAGAERAGCVGYMVQYYAEDLQFDKALATRYCGVAADWQLPPGQMLSLISSFKPDVVLANWAVLHRLWHGSLEEFEGFLKALSNKLDKLAASGGHKPRYMFWLSIPFLVSEREPHCNLERAVQYNAALRKVLEPRGWIEVDWMAMTRKWSFDIRDGMHHGQPPIRMLAYMLMHHVCHGED